MFRILGFLAVIFPMLSHAELVGKGGDVLILNETLVAVGGYKTEKFHFVESSDKWYAFCDAWKKGLEAEDTKRDSELLDVTCGAITDVASSPMLISDGVITLSTDNFRGRIVKVQENFTLDRNRHYLFDFDLKHEKVPGYEKDLAKQCKAWIDKLEQRFGKARIVFTTCGVIGEKGFKQNEQLGAIGKAFVAIDN